MHVLSCLAERRALPGGGLRQEASEGCTEKVQVEAQKVGVTAGLPAQLPTAFWGQAERFWRIAAPLLPTTSLTLARRTPVFSRYLLRKKFYRAVGAPDEEALVCAISERPQIMTAFCIEVGLLSKLAEKKLQCIKLPRLCSTAKP